MKLSVVCLAALVGAVASFSNPAVVSRRQHSALFVQPEHFDRAVECATKGHCDVNELERLADGTFFAFVGIVLNGECNEYNVSLACFGCTFAIDDGEIFSSW